MEQFHITYLDPNSEKDVKHLATGKNYEAENAVEACKQFYKEFPNCTFLTCQSEEAKLIALRHAEVEEVN